MAPLPVSSSSLLSSHPTKNFGVILDYVTTLFCVPLPPPHPYIQTNRESCQSLFQGTSGTTSLVQVTILSHLDYCSSLLHGLLVSSFVSPSPLVLTQKQELNVSQIMSFLCLKPSFSVISQRKSQSLQGPIWLLHLSFCPSDHTSCNSPSLCLNHTVLLVIPHTNLAGSCLRALALAVFSVWNALPHVVLSYFPNFFKSYWDDTLSVRLSLVTLSRTATTLPSFSFFPSTFHYVLLIYLTLLSAHFPKYKLHEGKDLYSFWYSQHLHQSYLFKFWYWALYSSYFPEFLICDRHCSKCVVCSFKNSELSITMVSILQMMTLRPDLK